MVGPRPKLPENIAELEPEDLKILSVRPGITLQASLKYANEEEILALHALQDDPDTYLKEIITPDKIRLNLKYIEHRSFGRDLKVILLIVLMLQMKDPFWN
jgi:lipopolysaccharide/colanic/teichoic acid biosynthesis glycosyltransferase